MPKLNDIALKRAIQKLGIKWPGDGDYGFGTEVYVVGSNRVVRLVELIDNKGQYRTDDGGTYTEKRSGSVVTQDYRPNHDTKSAREPESLHRQLRQQIISYLGRRKEPPTILHISFDDLMTMVKDEPSIAETGSIGLDIALVPRGQKMSVDRRI